MCFSGRFMTDDLFSVARSFVWFVSFAGAGGESQRTPREDEEVTRRVVAWRDVTALPFLSATRRYSFFNSGTIVFFFL